MICFKKKILHLSEGPFLKFCDTKTEKKIKNTTKERKKCLLKNSLRYLLPIQNYMKHCQLQKSMDPTFHPLYHIFPAYFSILHLSSTMYTSVLNAGEEEPSNYLSEFCTKFVSD